MANPHLCARTRTYALSMFGLWIVYLTTLQHFQSWGLMGVPHMEPLFADLHAILSARECFAKGLDVFVTNPCDVMGRIHVYGSAWLTFSQIEFGAAPLWLFGVCVGLTFMGVAIYLIKPNSKFEFIVAALMLFSPAVTLGLERANNDLIIFLLVALSATLFNLHRQATTAIGFFAIYLATVLKMYPVILFFIPLIVTARPRKELATIALLLAAAVFIWFFTQLGELRLLRDIVPKPLDHYVTGARALYTYLGRPFPSVLVLSELGFTAIFIASFVLAGIGLAHKIGGGLTPTPNKKILTQKYLLFMFGFGILVFTYLLNSNYDYRWIFYIFLIPLLFEIRTTNSFSQLRCSLVYVNLCCAGVLMWTEALRATRFFGLYNFNIYFSIGRSTFSIELIQQYVKELAAWGIFSTALALAIHLFPRRGVISS